MCFSPFEAVDAGEAHAFRRAQPFQLAVWKRDAKHATCIVGDVQRRGVARYRQILRRRQQAFADQRFERARARSQPPDDAVNRIGNIDGAVALSLARASSCRRVCAVDCDDAGRSTAVDPRATTASPIHNRVRIIAGSSLTRIALTCPELAARPYWRRFVTRTARRSRVTGGRPPAIAEIANAIGTRFVALNRNDTDVVRFVKEPEEPLGVPRTSTPRRAGPRREGTRFALAICCVRPFGLQILASLRGG